MRFLLSAVAALACVGSTSASSPLTCANLQIGSTSGCVESNRDRWAVSVDAGAQAGGTTFVWTSTTSSVSFSAPSAQGTSVYYDRTSGSCVNKHIVAHVTMVHGDDTLTCTADLHVEDDTQPVISFTTQPVDKEVEVGGVAEPDMGASASDDCDGDIDVVYSKVTGEPINVEGNQGMYSLTRTWTATDVCGNSKSRSEVIDVIDTTAPTLDEPDHLDIACTADIPTCDVTATDDGTPDVAVVLNSSDVSSSCEHAHLTLNTYTAVDNNGNSASYTQTIKVSDTDAPVMSGLPQMVTVEVECNLIALFTPPTVSSSDNCDLNPVQTYKQEIIGDATVGEKYSMTRTWSVVDACGNSDEFVQTISVVDTVPPSIVIDPDVTEECGAHPHMYNNTDCVSTVTDQCDDAPTVQMSETRLNGTCENEYQLVHTYIVADNAANTAVHARTVTVVDNSIPTLIGVPADTTVPCEVPEAANVTAKDDCESDVTTAELTEQKLDADLYYYRWERVWSTVDKCGHTATESQTIIVQHAVDPAFANEEYVDGHVLNVTCDAVPDAVYPVPSGECCEVTLDYTEERVDEAPESCTEKYSLIRTWTATDCASNSKTHTLRINVASQTPVLHNVPNDLSPQQFPVDVPVANVTATDACYADIPVVFTEYTVAGTCDNDYIVVRSWSTDDGCEVEDAQQTIIVVDTLPPAVTAVSDRTTTCNVDSTPWTTTAVDTSDNSTLDAIQTCDAIEEGSCDNEGSQTCTWTATDACGNTHSQTATDTWTDDVAPVLTCSDLSAETVPLADTCAPNAAVEYSGDIVDGNGCNIMEEYHEMWTAVDNCGNEAVPCTNITLTFDETPPEMDEEPEADSYICRNADITDFGSRPGTDNYAGNADGEAHVTNMTFAQIKRNKVNETSCGFQIVTEWLGSDCAGNPKTVVHVATVDEAASANAVVFSDEPADVTFECGIDTYSPEPVNATTFCGGATLVQATSRNLDLPNDDQYISVKEYTWSFNDGCNSNSYSQTVTFLDTLKPNITVSDATDECGVPEVGATSVDSCHGTAPCTSTEDVYGSRDDSCYTIIKSWTCTDDSGNYDEAVQTLSAYDESAPTFDSHPDDFDDECDTPAPVNLTANDNCWGSPQTVVGVQTGSIDSAGTGEMVNTWSVTDLCGSKTVVRQTVAVNDTLAPSFDAYPVDTTSECNATAPDMTGSDTCSSTTVEIAAQTDEPGSCPFEGLLITQWLITDENGNTDDHLQTISYSDTTPPEFVASTVAALPVNVTLGWEGDYEASNPAPDLAATDNCGTAEVTCSHTESGDSCHKQYTWTCVATDECGLTTPLTDVFITHVIDGRQPFLMTYPEDFTIECDVDMPDQTTVTSTYDFTVSPTHQWTNDEATFYVGCRQLLRRWDVSHCDLTDTHTQTITVEDNETPEITLPAWESDECSLAEKGNVPVVDACGDATHTVEDERVNATDVVGFNVTRTVTAYDACGNTAVKRKLIQVFDTTPPELAFTEATLADDSIEAYAGLTHPTPTVTASDNCIENTLVPFEETVQGTCPWEYTVYRSWTATDKSGNTDYEDQTIIVADTTKPVLHLVPNNVIDEYKNWESLHEQPPAVYGTDTADVNVTVEFTEDTVHIPGEIFNFTVHRAWSATDDCGNTQYAEQTIQIISPEYCDPAPVTINCEDTSSLADGATYGADLVADGCALHLENDVNVTWTSDTIAGSCDDTYQIVRTYTIIDTEGELQSVDITQTISVSDTEAPEFVTPTANHNVLLNSSVCLPTVPDQTATDNCDNDVSIEKTTDSNDVRWITDYVATDNCGNTASHQLVQTIIDQRFPEWTSALPADTTELDECSLPAADTVTCTGVCGYTCTVVRTPTDLSAEDNDGCTSKFSHYYKATDSFGRILEHTQVVIFADRTEPTVTAPEDPLCECREACTPQATAQDECEGVVTATLVTDSCTEIDEDEEKIVYNCTYQADDGVCGNVGYASGNKTEFKDLKPYWTFTPEDYESECSDNGTTAAIAADYCDTLTGQTVVTTDEVYLTTECSDNDILYELHRTFSISDTNGGLITHTQTVTVTDHDAPTLHGAHLNHNGQHYEPCEEPTIVVSAADDCGLDAAVVANDIPVVKTALAAGAPGDFLYSWSATDVCGHVTTESITINIYDTVDPVFTRNSNTAHADLECGNDDPPADATSATVTDNCDDDIQVDFTETTTGTVCDGTQTIRTWTATDDYSNTAVHSQTIDIATREKPVCQTPNPTTIECDDTYTPLVDGDFTCSDPCNLETPVVSAKGWNNSSLVSGCSGTSSGAYQYETAADECGRTTLVEHQVTQEDSTPPTFTTTPSDDNGNCDYNTPDVPTFDDNCGTPDLDGTVVDESADGCGGTRVTLFTITDDCGLTTTHTLTQTWTDDEDPVINDKPAVTITLECTEDYPTYNLNMTDDCTTTDVTHSFTDLDASAYPDALTFSVAGRIYSWHVADDCGNTDSHETTVTKYDTIPPRLEGNFEDIVVECGQYVIPPATASDNCTTYTEVDRTHERSFACGVTGTTVVTYVATDDVGHTTTEYKTITVEDNTAPTLSFNYDPVDATLNCTETYTPATCTAVHEECSNDDGACTMTSTVLSQSATTSSTEYLYYAEDVCGNSVTTAVTINFQDVVKPTIAVTDHFKDCEDAGFVPPIQVDDNCDANPTSTYTFEKIDGSCDSVWMDVFTFTAYDEQNNQHSVVSTVQYSDMMPPTTYTTPIEIYAERDCTVIPAAPEGTCEDDCSVCTVSRIVDDGCADSACKDCKITYHMWSTDDCGNFGFNTTIEHVISDTTPPTIKDFGGFIDEETSISAADMFPPVPTVTFQDDCGSVTSTFNHTQVGAGCTVKHLRTWSTTDECGLTSSWEQTINVDEDVDPTFDGVAPSVTVECGISNWLDEVPVPTAQDRTGNFLSVTHSSTLIASDSECTCKKTHVVTWAATDDCTNSATAVTTVVIADTVPPTFTCKPDDQRVQCGAEVVNSTLHATDVSSSDLILASSSHVDLDYGCGSVIKTYVATDCSDNSATHVQTIIVKDDEAPIFSHVPLDISVECGCDTVPPAPALKAVDNCDGVSDAVVESTTVPGTGNEYEQIYTFAASDSCGNAAAFSQTVTVADQTPPTFAGCADETVSDVPCDEVPLPPVVSVTDECDAGVTTDMIAETTGGDCSGDYTLVRTWSATDANGNPGSVAQTLSVVDTEAPQALPATDVPTCFAPNRLLYPLAVADIFPFVDNCDNDVILTVASCNSTEVAVDDNGAFTADCSLSADEDTLTFKGEVSSSNERVYTVYATLSDGCGNTRNVNRAFSVPPTIKLASEAGCAN